MATAGRLRSVILVATTLFLCIASAETTLPTPEAARARINTVAVMPLRTPIDLPDRAKVESRFEQALRSHVEGPSTLRIVGTYRSQPIIHYLDPTTRLNVLTDRSGNFISAWRVSDSQFMNIWYRGSL